jgi:NADH dehydrogenase (ubiquinone) 1 alpha subcomplex subunit 2
LEYSDYVAKNYTSIKKLNPDLPILIREASGAEARVFARFGRLSFLTHVSILTLYFIVDKGVEHKAVLQNATSQDIEKALELLVKSA